MQRYPLRDITSQFKMERPGVTTFLLTEKSADELYQEHLAERIRSFRQRPDVIKFQLGGSTSRPRSQILEPQVDLASLSDVDLLSKELDDFITNMYLPK